MKILIASDLYWPVLNGVSTFARSLAQGLASRGHEVLVIAPSQTGRKYRETDGNYTIARTATVVFPFYQNYRISLYPNMEVKKIIKEFKPDVVHIQGFLMVCQAVMKYSQKYDIPIVSTNHAMPENLMDNLKMLAPISRPINYAMKKYIARYHLKTDYFTIPKQSAIDIFDLSQNKMKIPVEAVSNGIDLSHFSVGVPDKLVIAKFNLPTDRPIIDFVGRVDAEKHISVLVRAFAKVLKRHKAHLLIVGDGTDKANLHDLAKKLGIENAVTFTGRITDEEKEELYKLGSVLCMPSPVELQSIVMLEAMASGQPVVAVDAGPLKELCQNGRNGFLCDVDNDDQIADGLAKIISDKKLHDTMSKESVAIAATHDLTKTLKKFESIYKSVIKKRS
ncbi:glycosyltransferase family 4 protein [Candidatus Saccharibacteria bacterium]|nr:glycosyltransferase family 4 protein [Candidatus Saccharibacteria bacterium]